jgi:DNA invertase Pin-like site-specific DNA recombinase
MKFGYIRVSTREQNPERQLLAMKENGIEEKNIYVDYMSGKDFARPQYRYMLRKLKEHDLLVIKSIDRLGRNYEEILEQWRILTKEKKVDIQVLDMPLLNTQTEMGDLMGVFIADLVLQILAYVAETERTFIRQRQAEGIAVAKAKGIHFGCKKIELAEDAEEVFQLYERKEISAISAAQRLQISKSTFYRRYNEKKDFRL